MKGSRPRRRLRFSRVGLVAKVTSREALRLADKLSRALSRAGAEVVFDLATAARLEREGGLPTDRLGRAADLVVALGGDGTLLSAARTAPSTTPVLGINVGRLGFLAGLKREEAIRRLPEVLAGEFREEKRLRLEVEVREGTHCGSYLALNDAVVHKEALSRISSFSIALDGKTAAEFRADGVIVSTPTGSTAYNLSAGGPILHPNLPAMVITPICPHTFSQRPLVVPAPTTVGIRVLDRERREGVFLTLDGQEGFPIGRGTTVEVRAGRSRVTLLRPPEADHISALTEKLNWGT
jgi:NAD+ kinase